MTARGPDGKGLWVSGNNRCGLVHRGMAIIDLTESGHQPMVTKDDRFRINFNGKIYNYIDNSHGQYLKNKRANQ